MHRQHSHTFLHIVKRTASFVQFLWSWRPASTGGMHDSNTWDACLVATVSRLAASVDDAGLDYLEQPPILALCHILACTETATLWLKAWLDHASASGTKGAWHRHDIFSLECTCHSMYRTLNCCTTGRTGGCKSSSTVFSSIQASFSSPA